MPWLRIGKENYDVNMLRGSILISLCLVVTTATATEHESKQTLQARYLGKTFYLNQNLHCDTDGESSWINFVTTEDFVPVGTKITVSKVKSEDLVLLVEGSGRKIKFDLDDALPDYHTVIDRVLGNKPPSLVGLSPIDLEGIKSGRATVGMSRKGIFISVGYPPYGHSPHVPFMNKSIVNHDPEESTTLEYMNSDWDFITFTLRDGLVVSIED